MKEIAKKIRECKRCPLHKTITYKVIGRGSLKPKILFVGESPGYNEDIQGKAFVGEAGKVLDLLLDSINLDRNDIYITNVLKCHPPKNHNPTQTEIAACIQYLHKQIEILKPEIVVTLGKFATREVFNKFSLPFTQISELHGKVFNVQTLFLKTKIIPLFHPSAACYRPEMLDILKQDFKKLEDLINA